MPKYYIRVSLDLSFAQKKLSDADFPTNILKKKLPPGCELLFTRYTFAVFTMDAVSIAVCREIFSHAWESAFPDDPGAARFFIAPNDGTDTGKLMYSIYTCYYGADNYIELTTRLAALIPLLKERGALSVLRKQSYLFVCDKGCGFSTLISSFANYLNRFRVFEEENGEGENNGNAEIKPGSRTTYSESVIGRETAGNLVSTDDYLDILSDKKKSPTDAVIGIDISYFLDGEKIEELREFARALYKYQDTFVFAFRVPFLEKKALDRIEKALSDVVMLRSVQIPPLHDIVLLERFWDHCRACGYSVSQDVFDIFFDRIREEKKDGRFYGFKTCEKIACAMILEKAESDGRALESGASVQKQKITPNDLVRKSASDKHEVSGYEQLAELIGMEKITEKVREIVSQVKMTMKNDKLDRPSIHMRFLGAPGTGKTTVARIIGQIFREEGILRKGAFFEYTARTLCAEYVGQTAVKTAAICRDAYGSVLFLDEAYALYDGEYNSKDYGREALATLISEMENHRDDMLVIMAGYTDDMETLMKGNAGLRSRMPYMLNFENYTRNQLFEIFMLMVRKHFEYTPEFEQEAKRYFESLSDSYLESKEFANARFVRNLYERTWSKGALRCSLDGRNGVILEKTDFIAASGEKEFSERLERKAKIGF